MSKFVHYFTSEVRLTLNMGKDGKFAILTATNNNEYSDYEPTEILKIQEVDNKFEVTLLSEHIKVKRTEKTEVRE